jgi:uncharacterized membrane protein (DUF106 family)
MFFFAKIISWMNLVANALGRFLLAPIAVLPGWLSNTIISALVGVFLLVVFKYTSNQRAIGKVRDDIKAHMLALKLFKDSLSVILRAEAGVLKGALLLLFHALLPMLVMIVPMSLLLAQMNLWYQFRPLRPGEVAVMTVKLNDSAEGHWPTVSVEPTPAVEVTVGPVRIFSRREICWEIKALKEGKHCIRLHVDQQQIQKELAIGQGFMRVSPTRPASNWASILMHPAEEPFAPDSIIQSAHIDYPERLSRTSGADGWLIYFFIASMVFAFIARPFLKVRI